MNRPRKYYGWVQDGKYRVSVFSGAEQRGANWYNTKEEAELEAKKLTPRGQPAPTIDWEHNG